MAGVIAAELVAVGWNAFFASVFAYTFVALMINAAARAFVKKPMQPNQFDSIGRTTTIRQSIAPWDIVVGRVRKGGVITFVHQSDDKKQLHMVITLAGHESQEIEEVWFDDYILSLDSNGLDTGRYGKVSAYSAIVPASPHQLTVPDMVNFDRVRGKIGTHLNSDGDEVPSFGYLTDVSPAAPSSLTEFNRSGSTFTFHSTQEGNGISVRFTKGYIRAQKSLGTETGQPFPDLVSESAGKWTNTHLQKGHTKIYARLTASPDLFPAGVPNITVVLRGAKVYDPRTATMAWSANPALWIAHYLTNTTYGLGAVYATEIDETDLIAAANACDERVSLATATTEFTADDADDSITLTGKRLPDVTDGVRVSSTGTLPAGLSAATTYYVIRTNGLIKLATSVANALAGTAINITDTGTGVHTLTYWDEPRYRANGAFSLSEKPQDIIQRLLASMAGKLVMFGDKWHIQAGVYYAPTFTLDDGDFRSGIQSQVLLPRTQNANAVKGVFTDPNNSWQPNSIPPIVSSTYLAEDGERIWLDTDFTAFVTSGTQTQRLAKIILLSTRQNQSFTAQFSLAAWKARCGMTVGITNTKRGWSSKAFEVLSSRFIILQDQALGIEIQARETSAAIFDWSTSEEQTVDLAPNTNFPQPFFIAAPGAPTVTETLYETTGSAGLKTSAEISVDPVEQARYYRFAYRLDIDDLEFTVIPDTADPFIALNDIEPGSYVFRCAAVNFFGSQSDWSAETAKNIVGLTAAPSDATNFSVIASNGFAVARWDLSPDLDVKIGGRAIIRHSPLTTGATWEDGILISGSVDLPGFPGDTIMSPPLPLKTGTYMLKFRDSSGNYSTNMVAFVATEGMVTGFTTLTTVTEDAAFTGAKTDIVKVGSAIQIDESYLSLPGESGDYASTPDSAPMSITGDIDLRCKAAVTDWTPASRGMFINKDNGGANGCYSLYLETDGKLIFGWDPGTGRIEKLSTVATGFTDGTAHWVRGTLDVNNGAAGNDVKFYTSDDYDPITGTGTWTQLGTTVTTAGTTSIADTTFVVELGTTSNGTANRLVGKIYHAEIYNGIAGTRVAWFDASRFADAATSAVMSTGETWTINQSGSPTAFIQAPTNGGRVLSVGTYTFANGSGDLTTSSVRRFEAAISALSFDIGDLVDGPDDWDSSDPVDGGTVNDCNVQLYARLTDDDPDIAPTWGGWIPFHVADFKCRGAQFKLEYESANPSHNIAVDALAVAIKVPA